ncbi:ParB N-terminal domain-containing protein [Roseofilum sp. Belize Diploria]|uniref:ParB N-terminal domain-containing protein n=1 Tax=Roseofilum sp. Belize Diploria TaxID=2821501 RepID=UPI001B255272|nr:ParB N-terminal domain-containing protein [Roseofilum sp. Belize Diploria]MBP0009880.1 ParB N-terminal domain-containing protein [Roseofilum sp. Belize Diploria]
MSEYYLVDVKSIKSKVARSQFSETDLETLAQSIVNSGGLLAPLLLKRTGAESYEILAGDREYYAAVRAKEINPRAAEMVNAFVVPQKLQEAALEQVSALHPQPTQVVKTASEAVSTGAVEQRLNNLESRFDATLQEMKQTHQQAIKDLQQQINGLQEQIPAKIEPLELLNHANSVELLEKLAIANIRAKTADKIIKGIEKARKQSPFQSFSDAINRIEGLGIQRMITLLDAWGNR